MEPSKEYDSLFRQYSDKSQEELERIISSEGDYTELAKKAARDVLNSDRTEYYQKITEQVNKEKAVTQKIEITQNHPLYHDIPVSYTHLDVYKRQMKCFPRILRKKRKAGKKPGAVFCARSKHCTPNAAIW